jgi:palmitoyltransferase
MLHTYIYTSVDPSVTWPPPDPDRIPRATRSSAADPYPFVHGNALMSNQEVIESFQKRQEEDMKRWVSPNNEIQRRRPFHKRQKDDLNSGSDGGESDDASEEDGEEGWRNSEGERLADFGVDESVEFYDDDVPLSELLRRKRAAQ